MYCRFCFPSNFSAPYPRKLWLVQMGILHCSLQPVQTINFPGAGAEVFEGKQNRQYTLRSVMFTCVCAGSKITLGVVGISKLTKKCSGTSVMLSGIRVTMVHIISGVLDWKLKNDGDAPPSISSPTIVQIHYHHVYIIMQMKILLPLAGHVA